MWRQIVLDVFVKNLCCQATHVVQTEEKSSRSFALFNLEKKNELVSFFLGLIPLQNAVVTYK